jgi:sulfatase modifying factor 1
MPELLPCDRSLRPTDAAPVAVLAVVIPLLGLGLPISGTEPEKEITNSIGMKLVLIPKGKFQMGSPMGEEGRFPFEHQHDVEITRPFYLGKYEATRGQFRKFIEANGNKTEAEKDGAGGYGFNKTENKFEGPVPIYSWRNAGFDQTDEHPVVNVTWNDAQAFCNWLSSKEGKKYVLPTEAQWEYACRANTTTRYWSGDDAETLAAIANVPDAAVRKQFPDWITIQGNDGFVFTAPVGRFKANAFGLHDMHGNVWEWCQDCYDQDYYKTSPVQDPPGPEEKATLYRVMRGGSFGYPPRWCRSACRYWSDPAVRFSFVGFRVVCVR